MLNRPSRLLPADHPSLPAPRIGVLIMNLGTPEATSYWPMRRYLKEFLSDRRVIETNRIVWWFILNGVVLVTRPSRSGRAYEKVWNRERNESPLKTITREQSLRLGEAFGDDASIAVDWAMRYGLPPIADGLEQLRERGCERILLAPLYPQYSAASTATALDKAYEALAGMRWQPAIRTLPPYYDHPAYIAALAQSLRSHLDSLAWTPEKVLLSYHGLPEDYVEKGDPYRCQCLKTSRLLQETAELGGIELMTVFQSRFGRTEWLKPYADRTVEELARSGTRRIVAMCPGFSADCLETLEEVGMGLRETFKENGGSEFSTVPCLNASDISVSMLKTLVEEELAGWRRSR